MFNTLLIANRGEIACRIIKTARRLGIECVAIYSTADRDSLHVSMADRAYCVGEPDARASYLNIDAIIAVAKQANVDAIHPGYGFLSENPKFARACADAGIIFVGPSVSAMEAMASKQLSKQLLAQTIVPLTPGYHGNEQSDATLLQEAKKIGFPILLKAASGGGGKGMRTVETAAEFQHALESARREANACFGDDIMIIEKYITHPRHVEIQIMADNFGQIVHLFDRDCSIQRRHQKIIEEAPAPNLPTALHNQLADAAIEVARAIDYRGAGTIEFLVSDDAQFYFMEMNTRLQVEHPVTEMITGQDLVEWQLRIAANEPLPCNQEQIQSHGHAIECRIYAEDPHHQFMPSTGTIDFLKTPTGDGIRIDTGIQRGSQITMHYDPMVAKLIAFGASREEAIQRLEQAIKQYWIGGIKTNLPLLQAIIEHPRFKTCELSTHFLIEYPIQLSKPSTNWGLLMAASVDYLNLNPPYKTHLQADTFAWQMHLKSHWTVHYLIDGEQQSLLITPIDQHSFKVTTPTGTTLIHAKLTHSTLSIDDGQQTQQASVDIQGDSITFFTNSGPIVVERFKWQAKSEHLNAANHQLTSPMPATIVAILKKKGESIKTGEPLIVLEAMKMEHTLHSPSDGIVTDIFYKIGAQVTEGAELIAVEKHP